MKHFTITFLPDNKQIVIHHGATIVEAAARAGIIINTVCGSNGTCNKCEVVISPDNKKVLACQYRIYSDLTVTVADESRFFEQKILEWDQCSAKSLVPDIYKRYAEAGWDKPIYGLAVDIGTTTIVAKLIDMVTGVQAAVDGTMNPQIQFGDDVIARIEFARNEENRKVLQKSVVDTLNKSIVVLCKQANTESERIFEAAVVGNTVMNHLFVNLPVAQLGKAPYEAYSLEALDIKPARLNLDMNAEGNIHTVENIAGFVGSDTVAAGLAVNIAHTQENSLLVDIGTNGEIVLATGDRLYSVSCAAGPSFEGARIIQGSRAAKGAIEAVVINDSDIDVDVIGNCQAVSICGSGLIDAAAVMLELGIIDRSGRFVEKEKLKDILQPNVYDRLISEKGQAGFVLARCDNSKVAIYQADIRQLQLAKAAIRTGIVLLQKKLGLADSDIDNVLLSGAFGNYIDKENALKIGLLPDIDSAKVHFVGNAAAAGAEMILINSSSRENAKQLAEAVEYIEIAREQEFTSIYAESMLF